MPYIEVDEVPEGTEEADVIPRSEYDAIVTERDGATTQRDEALERITQLEGEVREVKAKYADRILSSGRGAESKHEEAKPEPSKLAVSADGLWK